MRCICRHFARSDRSYLDSLCTVIGRGGEQLHSFLAFLLHAAGEGFGEGVGPQIGEAIAWDGEAGSRGGSCWEILNYIFIKKTVLVVGEDLVYFSD